MPPKKSRPPRSERPPLSPVTLRIIAVIRRIPTGKAASYGQVAALAGLPRGARQVARILHGMSERERLPWHRVVDRNGRISLPMDGPGDLQRRLLIREGLRVSPQGLLSLERFGWQG
jgi:methylated-DNA-protein-cysteine methyltransferase related protein